MKVLISTPTSQRHEYCIERFLDRVRNLTHPVHLLLIDNTLDNGEYFEKLKKLTPEKWITVKRHTWNPDVLHPAQMLAHVREVGRRFFLLKRFEYCWNLDTDMFPPIDTIERFISHDKDVVGGVVHMFIGKYKMPAIIKWNGCVENSGFISQESGLDVMKWKELKKQKGLIRTYGVGASFVKRRVLKKVPWRTHPSLIGGEDIWFYTEANDKGFEFWCDTDVKIVHDNTDWNSVPSKKNPNIYFAMGPENAKGVVFNVGAGQVIETVGYEPPELKHIQNTN